MKDGEATVSVVVDQRIPMPDGAAVSARVYLPSDGAGSHAVILSMTPYGKDSMHEHAKDFAHNGFAVVAVDCRGRGDSDGNFWPYSQEGADGEYLVQWISAQQWCDGNIVMSGGSYSGMSQWWTAARRPRGLRSIVPIAASFLGVDNPSRGGIYTSYTLRWFMLVSARSAQFELYWDRHYWFEIYARRYFEHLPFADLASIAGVQCAPFVDLVEHADDEAYWNTINVSTEQFEALDIPILTIGGLFDGALYGDLAFYDRHLSARRESECDHYLLIGPWDHQGTRSPRREVGGLTFPDRALIDIQGLHVAWYRWTLGRGPCPSLLRDRFVYYVVGLNEWRYAKSLDAATVGVVNLYLSASGKVEPNSARLSNVPTPASPTLTYRYDPLDTRAGELYRPRTSNDPYLRDQVEALNLLGNGLAYESDPLEEEIVLTGRPTLRLYISFDVPDTDFAAFLYCVDPHGQSLLLGEDYLRARYRVAAEHDAQEQNGPLSYDLEFMFCSIFVERYSRFRLIVKCPNSPMMQKNYNSGGDVMYETAKDARTALVTLHHASPYESILRLPLGPKGTSQKVLDDDLRPWIKT
jgi:putative CocE/NonD family hydrolase